MPRVQGQQSHFRGSVSQVTSLSGASLVCHIEYNIKVGRASLFDVCLT